MGWLFASWVAIKWVHNLFCDWIIEIGGFFFAFLSLTLY